MSLLLCRQESVKKPYYIENLGVHIYSSQELCYVIYQHPLLVMEGFVNESLVAFIRDELDMFFLAAKLEKWGKSQENQDDLLIMILQECYYYRSEEINRYRHQLSEYRKMHWAELAKERADYLFRQKQYGKSIEIYGNLLQSPKDQFINNKFLGKVRNNMGASYARMFQFDQAFPLFEKNYQETKDPGLLKKLYQLTLLDPRIILKDVYLETMDTTLKKEWEKELLQARKNAEEVGAVRAIDSLFSKDPIKRFSGAGEVVCQWKQEYRTMA